MFSPQTKVFGNLAIRSAVCVLFVVSALTALGQSGRRLSKSPAVSVPTPEAKQPEKKPVANDKPRLSLIVGADRGDAFGGIPTYYYDSVLQSCAGRLDDSRGVRVEVTGKDMTRGDALKRAKAEKEAYVVWLRLRTDSYSASNSSGLDQIYIEYVVFEPTTAKVKTQGNCYQGAYRQGGVVLGLPTGGSNTMIAENRLKYAAQEAAERILKALNVALPSDIPIH